MMEILRMSNISPLTIPHQTHEPTSLNGYSIPAVCLKIKNLVPIYRNMSYYETESNLIRLSRETDTSVGVSVKIRTRHQLFWCRKRLTLTPRLLV